MISQVLKRFGGLSAAILALAIPMAAAAQTGVLAGTVVGPEGAPIRGAQVAVSGTSLGAISNDAGAFAVRAVPAGTHLVTVTRMGFATAIREDVVIRADQTTTVEFRLSSAALDLAGVVVSASRRAERLTEAPATVTRVDAAEVNIVGGNSFSAALKQIQGLDYIQIGATTSAVNARGFNSSFNNRMLMLEDNRVSVLPESGLPVGLFTTTPRIDVAGVEVIVGPGAALYGADASNGVLSIQTKDPLDFPGTTVEVSTGFLDKEGDGERGTYNNVQFRQAGVIGNIGYKLTGEHQRVDEFENRLTYVSGGQTYDEIGVDFNSKLTRGQGSVIYYGGQNRLELSGGMSINDGVGQTNVGRNQFDGWTYNFLQLQGSTPHWYVNLYRNQSQSGDSYAINRFSVNRQSPQFDGMTDEEVKKQSDWPSNGRLYAAEVQNNFTVSDLLGGDGNPLLDTHLVWGVQIRRDVVSSDRQWLTDRFDDEDVRIGTMGAYAQSRTPIHAMVDAVLALRVDMHDNYDTQVSPKAGLVVTPDPNHAFRFTYNRAFKSPTILQTNFWIPDFTPFVGVFGNTQGFTVRDSDGNVVRTYDPLVPEENTTWEAGYRGILTERLFVDVAGYYSDYTNFFSPLVIIADPLGATTGGVVSVASFGDGTDPIVGETGNPQITLTYFNLGEATVRGLDLGARYLMTDQLSARATFSVIDLTSRDIGTLPGGTEATSLNSPGTKWTLGVSGRDFGPLSGTATVRYVNGYSFQSGINVGRIPTFTTTDLTLGYDLGRFGSELMLNLSSPFTCRSADPVIDGDEGGCGFGMRRREMVNMPMIGTTLIVGVRFHR
jgi:outer membrane receptor for ferrienterochelin and colicins